MNRFVHLVLRLRWLILALSVVATVLAALQLPKVRIESDIVRYLPQDDPDVTRFQAIGEAFGNNHIGMVALEMDDVFSHDGLSLIRELTKAFEETEGVASVISLTNMMDFRATDGSVEVVHLVGDGPIPDDPKALAALRAHAMAKPSVRGGVVSDDGKVALIVCNLGTDRRKDLTARELMATTRAHLPPGVKVYFAGFPMTIVSINDLIMSDMRLLIPVVALVILGVLFAMFRTVRGVLLPLGTVGLATLWAIGVMTYLGYPITMVSAIMPVVLLAVGSAYGIHMVSRYNEDAAAGGDAATTVAAAMRAVSLPILAAGITTFIGFATLTTATMTIIRDFGVLTALGVVLGLVASITLIPVLLSFLPVKGARTDTERRRSPIDGLLRAAAAAVRTRPVILVGVALAVGAAGGAGIPQITTDVNMLNHFPKESLPRQSEELLQERFGGSAPLFLDVRGNLKDPWLLKNLRRFGQRIDALPGAARAQSIADILAELNRVMNGVERVPDTAEEVGNLWFFLDGQKLLEQMVDGDLKHGIVQARVDAHDMKVMAAVSHAVDAMLARSAILQGTRALPAGEARIEWVVDGVDAVLAKRRGHGLDPRAREAVRALVARPSLSRPVRELAAPAASVEAAVAYLASDEAEVELEASEQTAAAVALRAALAAPPWTIDRIAAALGGALEGTEAGADHEGLTMMAESIVAEATEIARREHIEEASEALMQVLGEKDADLRKAIAAELWDLYAPTSSGAGAPPPTIEQTGLHRILYTLNTALVRNQMESIALAMIFVLVLMVVQFRSLAGGLLAMIPITVATLVSFGLMAYAHIALDMATAMIASVTIGIGIDYTIHFLARFKKEVTTGASLEDALDATIAHTGRAILVNTLSVALGFLVLTLSGLIPLRHFGLLVALNMFLCAAGALTTLPATIRLTRGRVFAAGERRPQPSS